MRFLFGGVYDVSGMKTEEREFDLPFRWQIHHGADIYNRYRYSSSLTVERQYDYNCMRFCQTCQHFSASVDLLDFRFSTCFNASFDSLIHFDSIARRREQAMGTEKSREKGREAVDELAMRNKDLKINRVHLTQSA